MFLPSADDKVQKYLAEHPVSGTDGSATTMSSRTRRPGSTFDTSTTASVTTRERSVSGTSSMTSTVSARATESRSTLAVSPPHSSEVPDQPSPGGTGRKGLTIGLGVCLPLVALAVGWLVFWWLGKRRKAINPRAPQSSSPDMSKYVGPLGGHFDHGAAPDAGYPYDANSYGQAAQELPTPTSAPPVELEASRMVERSPMQSVMHSPVSGAVSPLGSDYSPNELRRYSGVSPRQSGYEEVGVASGVPKCGDGDKPSSLWGRPGANGDRLEKERVPRRRTRTLGEDEKCGAETRPGGRVLCESDCGIAIRSLGP